MLLKSQRQRNQEALLIQSVPSRIGDGLGFVAERMHCCKHVYSVLKDSVFISIAATLGASQGRLHYVLLLDEKKSLC